MGKLPDDVQNILEQINTRLKVCNNDKQLDISRYGRLGRNYKISFVDKANPKAAIIDKEYNIEEPLAQLKWSSKRETLNRLTAINDALNLSESCKRVTGKKIIYTD